MWPLLAWEFTCLSARLCARRFDVVIDFQGNLRSAIAVLITLGRRRLGFHTKDVAETWSALATSHRAEAMPLRSHRVVRNVGLARLLGWEGDVPRGCLAPTPDEKAWAEELWAERAGAGPRVLLHPAVSRFGAFKQWPSGHFRRLADILEARLDARVLVSWGPGEEETARAVGESRMCASSTTLRQFAALIQTAHVLVAADTGAVPMAALLGTTAVALYGPKDALVYGPWLANGRSVASPAPCSPCQLRDCEHRICMELILPEQVAAEVEQALGRRRDPSPLVERGAAGVP
jgi:ADP-heptose:LPS heptosyltransferase